MTVPLADQAGQVDVSGPGDRLLTEGAELHGRQVKDVGRVGQGRQLVSIEHLALNGVDALRLKLLLQAGRGKDVHADNPPPLARRVTGPLGHPREARPDLAANAQYDEIALQPAHGRNHLGRGATEQFFELFNVADRIWERFANCGLHGCTSEYEDLLRTEYASRKPINLPEVPPGCKDRGRRAGRKRQRSNNHRCARAFRMWAEDGREAAAVNRQGAQAPVTLSPRKRLPIPGADAPWLSTNASPGLRSRQTNP